MPTHAPVDERGDQGRRWGRVVIFGALFFFFWRPIEDYDIWFYMVSGREVARTGGIPDTMFYLLPLLGEPASYIEWGFGLLYHWVQRIGGYIAMTAVNAAIGAATMCFAYQAALGKRSWLQPGPVLGLAVASSFIAVRMNYRAETILLLAMAVTLWALERYADAGDWRSLVAIPVAGWLLMQMHPSVLFLLPVVGAYAIEFAFAPPPGRSRVRAVGALALAGAASVLLGCLNPYGWHDVILPLLAFWSSDDMRVGITEYVPALESEFAVQFAIMVGLGALTLVLERRRRISGGLLLALFGGLTLPYVRSIGMFALVLLGPLVRLGAHRLPAALSRRAQRLMVAAVMLVWLAWPVHQGKWGGGLKAGTFPEASAAYLREHLPGGHVLNFYDYGGFLAWALGPEFLVFVDGHDTARNRAVLMHDAIFRADPGWQVLLSRYRIDAICTRAVMDYSGRLVPLVAELASDPTWRLVVREPSGMLFVRADLATGAGLDSREVWQQTILEAQREAQKFPGHPEPWRAMATAWRALGDQGKAEEAANELRRRAHQAGF